MEDGEFFFVMVVQLFTAHEDKKRQRQRKWSLFLEPIFKSLFSNFISDLSKL